MDFYQVVWQGLRFYSYHGYFPEERILGNWYELDVTIHLESANDIQDDLNQTLDYGQVYQICQDNMKVPVDLLETLVEKIGNSIFHRWPHIKSLQLSLRKENPPLGQSKGNACIHWNKTVE